MVGSTGRARGLAHDHSATWAIGPSSADVHALNRSAVAAFAGVGCVDLGALTAPVWRALLLVAAVGAYGFAAWTGSGPGFVVLPASALVLTLVPIRLLVLEHSEG